MWQLPRRPLTIKQTIAQGYTLLQTVFSKMKLLWLMFFILTLIPSITTTIDEHDPIKALKLMTSMKFGVSIICDFLLVFWISCAFYHQLNSIMRNKPVSAWASLWAVLNKIPILIIAFMLMLISNVVGFLLFLLPGIYLSVIIVFYYPLIIIDDLGPIQGYKMAFYLVKNNWWRSALITLFPLLISLFLTAIAGGVIYLLTILFYPSSVVISFLHHYLQVVFSVVYLPISAVLILLQLHNLKLRKSAVSLEPTQSNLHVING